MPFMVYHPCIMAFTKKHILRVVGVIVLGVLGYFGYQYYSEHGGVLTSDNSTPPVAGLPQIDPASIGKVVTEKSTGKEFMSNQLIVEFTDGTTEADANGVIENLGGKMVAHFTLAPIYLVQVKDSGDGSGAQSALKKFQADKRVKKADLNYLTTAPTPTAFEQATTN